VDSYFSLKNLLGKLNEVFETAPREYFFDLKVELNSSLALRQASLENSDTMMYNEKNQEALNRLPNTDLIDVSNASKYNMAIKKNSSVASDPSRCESRSGNIIANDESVMVDYLFRELNDVSDIIKWTIWNNSKLNREIDPKHASIEPHRDVREPLSDSSTTVLHNPSNSFEEVAFSTLSVQYTDAPSLEDSSRRYVLFEALKRIKAAVNGFNPTLQHSFTSRSNTTSYLTLNDSVHIAPVMNVRQALDHLKIALERIVEELSFFATAKKLRGGNDYMRRSPISSHDSKLLPDQNESATSLSVESTLLKRKLGDAVTDAGTTDEDEYAINYCMIQKQLETDMAMMAIASILS
jgi:hypothetical protein